MTHRVSSTRCRICKAIVNLTLLKQSDCGLVCNDEEKCKLNLAQKLSSDATAEPVDPGRRQPPLSEA